MKITEEINPFLKLPNGEIDPIKVKSFKPKYKEFSSENEDNIVLDSSPFLMDAEKSINIYRNARMNKVLDNLTSSGLPVFMYIIRNFGHASKPGKQEYNYKEMIMLNASKIAEDKDKSRGTIYNGIKELINLDVIARSSKPKLYWVNIHLLFEGNRVEYVKELSIDYIDIVFRKQL